VWVFVGGEGPHGKAGIFLGEGIGFATVGCVEGGSRFGNVRWLVGCTQSEHIGKVWLAVRCQLVPFLGAESHMDFYYVVHAWASSPRVYTTVSKEDMWARTSLARRRQHTVYPNTRANCVRFSTPRYSLPVYPRERPAKQPSWVNRTTPLRAH
jgi:hypothetical protein